MVLRQVLLYLFLLLSAGALQAQNIEYGAGVDTNYMMIGDQQHLIFRVRSDQGVKISFPQLRDTVVRGVEIISGPFRDSVKESDGRWLIEEKYVITAFDSGVYVIPSMPITIENGDYNNVLRTESFGFVVNTYQVDPQKGSYDIVMPYMAPWTFAEILPYLLWVLLGLAVIALCWWIVVRYRKRRPLFAVKKEVIPPYVKAIGTLNAIKSEKLWQAGKEKEYYTKLTDTVRQYLDGEFGIPAMEQTSIETVRALQNYREVESKDKDRVAQMLETADYVKFAKFTPLQDENARYLDAAYDFVNNTHLRLQQEIAAREEQERKERDLKEKEEAAAPEKSEAEKKDNVKSE